MQFLHEIVDFYATLASPVVNFDKLGVHAIVTTPVIVWNVMERRLKSHLKVCFFSALPCMKLVDRKIYRR